MSFLSRALIIRVGLLFSCLAAGCVTPPPTPPAPPPAVGQAAELDLEPVLPLAHRTRAEALAWLSRGLAHDMRMEPEAAATAYRTALGLDAENTELRRFVFQQLLKTRQFEAALALAQESQTLDPASATAWVWEAQVRLLLRQPARSRTALETAIDREPTVVGPYLDLARLHFQDRRFEEAESVLLRARHHCPDSPLPIRFLADILPFREAALADPQERANYQASSLLLLDGSLTRFPEDTALLAQSARLLIALDRFRDALDRYRAIERTRPDDLETKVQLAAALLRSCGSREEALRRLRAHNASHPGDTLALLYEGLLVETGPAPAGAQALYEEALRGQPTEVTAFQKLAALLIETNDLPRAQAVLTEGLEKFPAHARLREWRAFLFMAEERHAEAHALFQALEPERRREAQSIADTARREREERRLATFYLQYALAAQSVGDLDTVPRALKEAVRHEPAWVALFTRHVYKLDETGERLADGITSLEALGRLMPDEPAVFTQLGVLCNSAKRHADAVGHFRRALRLAGQRGEVDTLRTAYFHFHFGSALERIGRLEEAETELRACIRLAPDFAEAKNYLAYMWAERALQLPEALELVEAALAAQPENPAYLDTRGWVHYQAGRLDLALRDIRRALAVEGMEDDGELLRHLGDVLWMMGHPERARAAWRKIPEDDDSRAAIADRLGWPIPGEEAPSELLPPWPVEDPAEPTVPAHTLPAAAEPS
jgi:tetratricopeptide (TPR) repeat protein